MKRRAFNTLLGRTAATSTLWSSSLSAQQKTMPVIGSLNGSSAGPYEVQLAKSLEQGLGETGYVEGRNVAIEYRWADAHYDRLPAMAAELVSRNVDVITVGSLPGAVAAKNATSTIPIVFALGVDPIANGLVASLARPGSNMTGVSILNVELVPKRFDLLSEVVPQAKTIALLVNPNNTNAERMKQDTQGAARRKGIEVDTLNAGTEGEIDDAFAALAKRHAGGLVVGSDPFLGSRRDQIAALASRYSVPTIFGFPTDGALISYGTSLTVVYRQAGVYVGRILKGAKPADLPVLQPTKFELVINMKTAKALGLTIPPSILARADEVIE